MQYKIPNSRDILEITQIYGDIMLHFIGCSYYIVFRTIKEYSNGPGNIVLADYTTMGYKTTIVHSDPKGINFKKCNVITPAIQLPKSQTFKIPIYSYEPDELDYVAITYTVELDLLKTYYMLINHLKYPTTHRHCTIVKQMRNKDGEVIMDPNITYRRYTLTD